MKKNILPVLVLILAALSLALSVICFASVRNDSDRFLELRRENEDLRIQMEALQAQLDSLAAQQNMAADLSTWTLDVSPWEDSTGADIRLTAVPAAYQEGMTASLLVQLEGQEILRLPCRWDGNAFTADGALSAADGYGYYCILTDADGIRRQIALTTPENPVEDIPVYLASSLTAYCNLLVDTWEESGDTLVLTAYAHVQLPRLSALGDTAIESAELVLMLNGTETARAKLSLDPGETVGSFESVPENLPMPIPNMAQDDCLDLHLEVTLSDGRQLSAYGASWFRTEDGLYAVVG